MSDEPVSGSVDDAELVLHASNVKVWQKEGRKLVAGGRVVRSDVA